MLNATVSCSKVSNTGKCPHCKATSIVKNGRTKTGKQQYYCKSCGKRSIDYYTCRAYLPAIDCLIVDLTKEGLGIRSTARVLKMLSPTLIKKILQAIRETISI